MKFYLILYAAGVIGGAAGPLPYDKDECERRANQFRYDNATLIFSGRATNGSNELITAPSLELFKTMRFKCELRANKPKLGEPEVLP